MQRALSIQVQQLFHRLMDAENALYRFQEGAQLLRSQGLEVNITHLLLESARKKDEERQRSETQKSPAPAGLNVLDEADEAPCRGAASEPSAPLPAEPPPAATTATATAAEGALPLAPAETPPAA
jgi:hypothetical protein